MRVYSSLLLASASTLLAASAAQAVTLTLQESVSPSGTYQMNGTYVRASTPSTTYDGDPSYIVGTTLGPDTIRALFSWDLSLIPAGSTITDISLSLTINNPDSGASTSTLVPLDVRLLASSINETTVTYASQPASSTTLSTASVNPTLVAAGNVVTWNSTSSFVTAAQTALNGGLPLSFDVQRQTETTAQREIFFFVGDDPTGSGVNIAANSPKLTITYVPEPATGALLTFGALALGGRRRRS